jgi:hypothetical protein
VVVYERRRPGSRGGPEPLKRVMAIDAAFDPTSTSGKIPRALLSPSPAQSARLPGRKGLTGGLGTPR